jgi:uroporphyrinogen-III decarboxylase
MYDEPEFVDALLGHIVSYYEASSRRIFEEAAEVIDIFFIGNDFGSQTGPLLGPEQFQRFKQKYGDKIVFNGGIDSHHVLIDGDSAEFVRQQTLEVLSIMAPGGGYIAGASHDSILEETPVENVLAMFDAVTEFSGHPRLPCVAG